MTTRLQRGKSSLSLLVARLPQEGQPLSTSQLWWHLAAAAEKAEIDHKTPYGARRRYATRLAEGGLDAFALADLMGHSDVSITRGYVNPRELHQTGEKPQVAC
jgi:site-specific recombinase XerD